MRPITPIRHPLGGKHVRVPASKSVANRELVLSAIAHGESRLRFGPLDPGDDVRAMCTMLGDLGFPTQVDASGTVRIHGGTGPSSARGKVVYAGEGGTVARFGVALAALGSSPILLDGSPRLRERPIGSLIGALRALGAQVGGDRLAVTVTGPLRGGHVEIAGNESSQFASALLLVAPRMRDGLYLRIAGSLVSAPFVELTIARLEARGVAIERPAANEFRIARQSVAARSFDVPGDLTASSYPAAAAAILGGSVTIDAIDARERPGSQGDARFFSLIQRMGCQVSRGRDAVTVSRRGALYGIRENVRDCSDVFPTLAVIAAMADGPTELTGIGHTRRQESDRIQAVATGLNALGARATAYADAIRIEPQPLRGATISAFGDHRIAMAFAVLGLQVPGVAIDGAETVGKTFPEFYDMLTALAR